MSPENEMKALREQLSAAHAAGAEMRVIIEDVMGYFNLRTDNGGQLDRRNIMLTNQWRARMNSTTLGLGWKSPDEFLAGARKHGQTFMELVEARKHIAALTEENAVLKSQVENHDVTLEQVNLNWKEKIATLTKEIDEARAQRDSISQDAQSLGAELEETTVELTATQHELENVWKPAAQMNADYAKAFEDQLKAARQDIARKDAALRATLAAHESLFGQCFSNPVKNAWGDQVDLSLLNDAVQKAQVALRTCSPTAEREQIGDTALVNLLHALDDAHGVNPFLWFQLGYTHPTDWMVHVWDRRGGGDVKIVSEQEYSRAEVCNLAEKKLRELYPVQSSDHVTKNPSTPMPDGITLRNGTHERCDMAQGPCACGTTHSLSDWPDCVRAEIESGEGKEGV